MYGWTCSRWCQQLRIRGESRRNASKRALINFIDQAAAPLPSRIPSSDLIGVTVILLTCSYAAQEFVRVGYYVNTEYLDPELKQAYDASLEEGSETKAPDASKHVDGLSRLVLSEKPRVTRFNIKWYAFISFRMVSTHRCSQDYLRFCYTRHRTAGHVR